VTDDIFTFVYGPIGLRVIEPGGRSDFSEVNPSIFSAFNFLEKHGECRYTAPAGHPFGTPPGVFDCIASLRLAEVLWWDRVGRALRVSDVLEAGLFAQLCNLLFSAVGKRWRFGEASGS